MPQVISFPPRQQFEPLDGESNGHPNIPENAELLQQMEREREKLIKMTNYLEALRATIGRHTHDGPHLSVAKDGPSATSAYST